ncbi:E3 ubiquitin-protein ligase SIRP1 [Sesamum alatum]|uniref:E3 ubiquitin-protein ligase SIRP1 n=1 Tax=Sesamum alatum TaxID=300844 RepID=A0AAE2CRF8_9LAMI|nr:E3 ubiquitin-protein ligase SIRP1 [Sesamum alatum]
MAGMLPGVEAARRRRFHMKSNVLINSYAGSDLYSPNTYTSSPTFTRRSSFCLYAATHDFHSNSSMRNIVQQQQKAGGGVVCDESRLGAAAREAKNRLDQRLQQQWRSQTKRTPNSQYGSGSLPDRPTSIQSNLHTEVPKLKKNGSKRLNWLKLSWKSSEQEECAVCLEPFKGGQGRGRGRDETLMQLPCGHRFHTNCLVPWLEANAHCPCCRMEIPS